MRRRQRCGRSAVGAEPEHRRVDRVDDLLAGVRLQVIVREGLGNDFRPDRQIFSQRFQKLVNLGGSFSSGKKLSLSIFSQFQRSRFRPVPIGQPASYPIELDFL